MLTFYQYLAFLIPFVFVLVKGYFLSIEFSLYPYLVSEGLLPYKNIVDQHLPSLFFGTFSLPFILVNSPQKLLCLLVGLNFTTTFLLLVTLKRLKVGMYQLWTLMFSLLLIFFSANTLWIETFLCLLLSILFYLNTINGRFSSFISGIIVSQLILLRPTLSVFFLGYFLMLQKKKLINFLGGFVGLALSLWYLIEKNILADFYRVAVVFNSEVYTSVQSMAPTTRQLLSLLVLCVSFATICLWRKKYTLLLLGLSPLALIYPRFGLEHLQVFGLVFIYFLSLLNLEKKIFIAVVFISVLIGIQPLLSVFKGVYGNYFYGPDIVASASQIMQLQDKNIYLYGASDLIYQLAEKLPPENYYLPSLPWYLNYPPFQDKLKQSLLNTDTIIIDPNFSVDGQKLVESTPEVYSYIKMNYYLDSKINNLEVYKIKK